MSNDSSLKENELQPIDQQKLEQAERLFEDEKPGQAAPLFAELAEKLTHTQPKRSASLHAQAAIAFVSSRNETDTVAQTRKAMRMFRQLNMTQAASFYYNKIIDELNDRKMTKAAKVLVDEFSAQIVLPDANLQPKPEQAFHEETGPRLPSLCPQCGAPVRSDEGRWIDGSTMLCMYCGTPIHVTN